MAELKVNIKGDDSDLKAKFRESSEDARIFQEKVEKSLDAIKEASQDVVKETGLGGILKLLGAGGLGAAVTEFSSKLVDGFKDAISAALDFQGQVGKLRGALGVAFAGQAEQFAERVQSISGVMGGFEENMEIFRGLLRGGMIPEQAFTNLVNIQNAAKGLGVDLAELGEKFVEMRAEGEVPPRMFREMPALAARVRAMLPPGGPETPGMAPEESLAARVKAAGGADWLIKTVLPALAPGGLQAPGRLGAEQSIRGQIIDTMEEFHKSMRELGTDLLPLVNAAMRELKNQMPGITESFKHLGDELERDVPKIVEFMHSFFSTGERLEHPTTAFGRGFRTVDDAFARLEGRIGAFIGIFTDPAKTLKEAAEAHKKAAENLERITHPR